MGEGYSRFGEPMSADHAEMEEGKDEIAAADVALDERPEVVSPEDFEASVETQVAELVRMGAYEEAEARTKVALDIADDGSENLLVSHAMEGAADPEAMKQAIVEWVQLHAPESKYDGSNIEVRES